MCESKRKYRDWEHEKDLKPSRKWSEPIRDGEFPHYDYSLHEKFFAAARRDFICLRRNIGGKARRALAHCRLPLIWSYFMAYFIVSLRINSKGVKNLLAHGNDQSWRYLYNFHQAVKEGATRF